MRIAKLIVIISVSFFSSVQVVVCQSYKSQSTTFNSYQRARMILEKAIKAHGGLEKIKALQNVTLEYDGVRTMVNQSRTSLGPWDKQPSVGRVVFDQKNNRLFMDHYSSYPGIGRFGGAYAIQGSEGSHWEPAPHNHHGTELIAKLSGAETEGPWAFLRRWMPPFMLLTAWDNNTNVRSNGTVSKDGQQFEALTFIQQDRVAITILVDLTSGLLEGFEGIRDDGVYGDVVEFIRFSDYRSTAGVAFPTRRTDYLNGEPVRELQYKVAVNTPLDESLFKLPQEVTSISAPASSERIKKIADGVHLDTEMGGIVIVEFNDFLVVLDCPGDYWMSQSTIEAVQKAIPGKAIRFVVPSHTHGDHGGGARAYYQLGATVLTTRGNVGFYKQLARIKQTIRPDPQSLNPKEPLIETFTSKRVISDGTQILELHDTGPNAHSEEMTFAYLPKQKLIWQSDLFFTPMTGAGLNKAMPLGIDFAKKLKTLGLDKFERMIESHHTRVITVDDFRKSLRMAGYHDF